MTTDSKPQWEWTKKQFEAEVTSLRARNRRLVEAVKSALADVYKRGVDSPHTDALCAAVEENDDASG